MAALLWGTNIPKMPEFQTPPDTNDVGNSLAELSGLGLADWLWATGILIVATLIGLAVGRVATRFIDRRTSTFIARLVGRFVTAVFMVVGFVYALNQLGVSIGPLLGLLGLAGLALALAFQDLLQNIIAGIFMSIRRPFDAGHQWAASTEWLPTLLPRPSWRSLGIPASALPSASGTPPTSRLSGRCVTSWPGPSSGGSTKQE